MDLAEIWPQSLPGKGHIYSFHNFGFGLPYGFGKKLKTKKIKKDKRKTKQKHNAFH